MRRLVFDNYNSFQCFWHLSCPIAGFFYVSLLFKNIIFPNLTLFLFVHRDRMNLTVPVYFSLGLTEKVSLTLFLVKRFFFADWFASNWFKSLQKISCETKRTTVFRMGNGAIVTFVFYYFFFFWGGGWLFKKKKFK